MMRIGISGAQSVGKTTLLNALRSEQIFSSYAICNEVTRRVKEYGLPINEKGNDATQRLIMNEHIVNLFLHENMLTDRTSLDGIVYSQYLYNKKKSCPRYATLEGIGIDDTTLNYAYEVFRKTIHSYDLLFYIKPEFNIVDDGTRSIDVDFRNEIVNLFEKTIEEDNIPVILLSGSVRERLETVLKHVNMKSLTRVLDL